MFDILIKKIYLIRLSLDYSVVVQGTHCINKIILLKIIRRLLTVDVLKIINDKLPKF